jgi:hypothetical protein
VVDVDAPRVPGSARDVQLLLFTNPKTFPYVFKVGSFAAPNGDPYWELNFTGTHFDLSTVTVDGPGSNGTFMMGTAY